MTSEARFNRLVSDAVAQSFTGWDFSFVADRLVESSPSWDYPKLVQKQIDHAKTMLDMCTGGGEFLDALDGLPPATWATEGFQPNVDIARQRLARRNILVVSVESDDDLPLPSNKFDLVINRHGAYSPTELFRVMQPGAVFLTQQVGADNALGLNEALQQGTSDSTPPNWRLQTAVDELIANGFTISNSQEEFPPMSFKDIGAVVYYLKAIPWQISGFDPGLFRNELLALHRRIEADGSFTVHAHRFLIHATRC